MSIGKRSFLAIAPAFIAAAFLTAALPCDAATENAQERRDGRDVKQEARQGGRTEKRDCKQANQSSNSDCRQDHREGKQDGRKKARDIKY